MIIKCFICNEPYEFQSVFLHMMERHGYDLPIDIHGVSDDNLRNRLAAVGITFEDHEKDIDKDCNV